MNKLAYHTTQINHLYEPLYLVIYDHSENLVAALISVTGECGAECAN